MDGEVELLGERIAEQAAHLDAATHRLLADLREFDARGGWHTQGAQSCAHWLAWRVGWDPVTARDRVRVARKLGEFPATDDALRRGELSYSKVRAILRVATPANEAMLLECARLSTASQLEKLSRKYARVQAHGKDARPEDDEPRRYVRRRDTEDGMVKIEAVLHPEEAELVWAMLDHAAKQIVREPQPPLTRGDSAESRNVADLTTCTDARCGTACPTADSAEAMQPNTIVWIVRRHLDRAGIRVAGRGAHALRHSLATRMVNAGVSIKSVADVLGHASIDTTAIYTKVDMTTLATVALPFPRGLA